MNRRSNSRRHKALSTNPYLVVGGALDGTTISVLSSHNGPIIEVVRLPEPISTHQGTELQEIERVEKEPIPYYAHQLTIYPPKDAQDMPWDNREPESVWFYSIDKELNLDEQEVVDLFSKIKVHRQNADDERAGSVIRNTMNGYAGNRFVTDRITNFIRKLLSKREGEPQGIYLSKRTKELLDDAASSNSFSWLALNMPTYYHKGLRVLSDPAVNDNEVVVVRELAYTYVDFNYTDHNALIESLDRAVFEMPSIEGALHSIALGRNAWHAIMTSDHLRYNIVLGDKENPVTLWGARLRRADDMEPNAFTAIYCNPMQPTKLLETFL